MHLWSLCQRNKRNDVLKYPTKVFYQDYRCSS